MSSIQPELLNRGYTFYFFTTILMIYSHKTTGLAVLLTAVGLSVSSCVDQDYDLNGDIDLNVNVGGKLITLPSSNTQEITLKQLLDLNDDSSIKAIETDGQYGLNVGDYALIQSAAGTSSSVKIDLVQISNHPGSTTVSRIPTFVNPGDGSKVVQKIDELRNSISLSDDNIDRQLVTLERAWTAVDINFELYYQPVNCNYNGDAYLNSGFMVVFPSNWTVAVGDQATAQFMENADNHTLRFTRDAMITPGSPMRALVRVTEVDFTTLTDPSQGLHNGRFALDADILSNGNVSMVFNSTSDKYAPVDVELVSKMEISHASISKITGIVNPDINIDASSFDINDIPDFINDGNNYFDFENPRFAIDVTNNSPVTLDVNGVLTAYKNGTATATCRIGSLYGTAPVTINPSASSQIIISQRDVNQSGADNVVIPNLGELLNTIPDRIEFNNISVKVAQTPVTIALGPDYSYSTAYEAVVPLSFGKGMHLYYTTDDMGWDSDLDKYNFNKVQVALDAVNTVPLYMRPSVKALDRDGNELSTVSVTVTGVVAPGAVGAPVTTPLEIVIESKGDNIGGLDGVSLVFEATAKNPDGNDVVTGRNLNAAQSLRLDNINISIVGGVNIDLND